MEKIKCYIDTHGTSVYRLNKEVLFTYLIYMSVFCLIITKNNFKVY